jgi:hypothetical protein
MKPTSENEIAFGVNPFVPSQDIDAHKRADADSALLESASVSLSDIERTPDPFWRERNR